MKQPNKRQRSLRDESEELRKQLKREKEVSCELARTVGKYYNKMAEHRKSANFFEMITIIYLLFTIAVFVAVLVYINTAKVEIKENEILPEITSSLPVEEANAQEGENVADDTENATQGQIDDDKLILADIQEIVAKVYILESSGGKHDSCRRLGKYNGYGFGIYKGKHTCFDTHEEAELAVANWFEDNLEKYTLAQSLCRYNTGKPVNNCPYYQKYLSL